jgi:hypothetical protein
MMSVAAMLALVLGASACQSSHDKEVKSNLRSQWTSVAADVKTTTQAAKAVLSEADLKQVDATSTNVDGKVTARKADGTKVHVEIRKQKEGTSEVSVRVGTMGEPTLGAEFARKIKDRAESGPMDTSRPSL